MKKIGQVFYGLIPILVYFVVQFIVVLIAGFVQGVIQVVKYLREGMPDVELIISTISDDIQSSEFIMLASSISAVVLVLIFTRWYRKAYKRESKEEVYQLFRVKNMVLLSGLAISLQVALYLLIGVLEIYQSKWFTDYIELMNQIDMGNTVVSFVYIVILAPIVEELLMRGLVLNQINKATPFLAANIIQAILFALIHGNMVQGLYSFVVGILLGYIYKKYKTIWSTIIFHAIFNLAGYLLSVLVPETLYISTIILILIGIMTLGISAVFIMVILRKEEVVLRNEDMKEAC